ncbi:MAG: hypothetical protein WCD66_10240, partial [Rhodanobacteraceae bacterium]
ALLACSEQERAHAIPASQNVEDPGATVADESGQAADPECALDEFRERHRRHERLMASMPCISFGSERRILDHRIVPLRNLAELREAGRRMCNHFCVADPERMPEHAHFLIIDGDGWAVAMFRSRGPTDRFDPAGMLGLCDMEVPGHLAMMAELYLFHEYCLRAESRASGEPSDGDLHAGKYGGRS